MYSVYLPVQLTGTVSECTIGPGRTKHKRLQNVQYAFKRNTKL